MSKEVSNYQTYITSPSVSTTTVNSSFENWLPKINNWAIGFDRHWDMLNNFHNSVTTTSYPPYNIIKVDEDDYTIEMAVAGFAKTDIEVTLDGDKLVIKGTSKDTDPDEAYVYKGIAARNFERTFTLADKVEIKDAEIVNGMLNIWLENIVKAQDAIKKIAVKSKD